VTTSRNILEFIQLQFPEPFVTSSATREIYDIDHPFTKYNDAMRHQFLNIVTVVERYSNLTSDYPIIENYPKSIDNDEVIELFLSDDVFGVSGYRLAREFIEQFLGEIREIICNKKRRTEASTLTNRKLSPLAASLSALVLGHFGVGEPVAIGIATYILIVVMEASKGAFCKTTDVEIVAQLRKIDPRAAPKSWDEMRR
jgi:hypothetical protein